VFKEKIKNLIKIKNPNDIEDSSNKKKIENIVVFVIILIITVIAINMIWNGENKKNDSKKSSNTTKILAEENNKEEALEVNNDNLEYRLENILKQIKGVGKVKVLITYSQTSETLAMYNEDSMQSDTEETDTRWWK